MSSSQVKRHWKTLVGISEDWSAVKLIVIQSIYKIGKIFKNVALLVKNNILLGISLLRMSCLNKTQSRNW